MKTTKNTKVKNWYKRFNPKDKEVIKFMTDVTFEDVWNDTTNVYTLCGVSESDVREVIFEELSNIYKVDYDVVYYKWLDSK
jgi:hypothetical protein